eukprot:TRINITY_DN33475_c0_g1_i1.p1 TRINITY_DN33475_c0_g1~~TRINITY_DN33475_c0_g1_i1.p1  ORF type:complete len:108 (-),score=14.51 TRINITY_DN33475_c0_g1_i1:119-442(-)
MFLFTLLVCLVSAKVNIESPESLKVPIGAPATLNCRTNSPRGKILWYKDGSLVDTESQQDRFLILPDGSMFFLSTQPEDYGSYHCNVVIGDEMYISDPAILQVGNKK